MSLPKLYDDEGDRIVALAIAGALLILVPLAQYLPRAQEPAPTAWCAPSECAAAKSALQGLVLGGTMDLNAADAASLEAFDGIGPKLAAEIVRDRERRGAFHSVEELDRVKGIGPARMRVMRRYLVVSVSD
jgi:competence ComEA-like helix-hairpin-helix protein